MGDTCCFPWSMGRIERLIKRQLPGITVYSVMVGNNIIEDEIHGFLGNVNEQIAQVAGKLQADSSLSRGFNAVGFSQVRKKSEFLICGFEDFLTRFFKGRPIFTWICRNVE